MRSEKQSKGKKKLYRTKIHKRTKRTKRTKRKINRSNKRKNRTRHLRSRSKRLKGGSDPFERWLNFMKTYTPPSHVEGGMTYPHEVES